MGVRNGQLETKVGRSVFDLDSAHKTKNLGKKMSKRGYIGEGKIRGGKKYNQEPIKISETLVAMENLRRGDLSA